MLSKDVTAVSGLVNMIIFIDHEVVSKYVVSLTVITEIFLDLTHAFVTHAGCIATIVGRAFSHVCMFVCLSVCLSAL